MLTSINRRCTVHLISQLYLDQINLLRYFVTTRQNKDIIELSGIVFKLSVLSISNRVKNDFDKRIFALLSNI